MKKKMLFIINPRSGKGQIANHLLGILDIFEKNGYEVTVHITQCKGDATEAARTRDRSYDIVACSGGDGTLDEVATGIVKSGFDTPVCYIPAGSTNDFAGSLMIPKGMKKAAVSAMEGKVFKCDLGTFNGDIFVYVAAFGIFTDVSYDTDQNLKNALGHSAYIIEALRRLPNVRAYHMRVETDEQTVEGDFLLGMVTNSYSVGGMKRPGGDTIALNDGLFEVILIRKPENASELRQLNIDLLERKQKNDLVFACKTSHLKISSPEEVAWTLDGEYGGDHKELEIGVLPGKLQIMAPFKFLK